MVVNARYVLTSKLSLRLLHRTQVRAKGLKPWHAVTLGAGLQTCVDYLRHDGPLHVPLKLQTEGPTMLGRNVIVHRAWDTVAVGVLHRPSRAYTPPPTDRVFGGVWRLCGGIPAAPVIGIVGLLIELQDVLH